MLGLGVGFYGLAKSSMKSWDPRDPGCKGNGCGGGGGGDGGGGSSGGGKPCIKLWLKNGRKVTAAQWNDSSGNVNHAAQGTTGNQATVVTPSIVDTGSLDFEGDNNHYYDLGTKITIATNENFLIAIVVTIESYDDQNCILSDGTNEFIEFETNKKIRIKTLDGSSTVSRLTETDPEFAVGSKMLIVISRNDGSTGTLRVYKNGELLGGTWSNRENPKGIEFANLGIRNDTDRSFDGIIHELVIYNCIEATWSDDEIQDLHTYMKMKHDL
jgi:hypothetical protein